VLRVDLKDDCRHGVNLKAIGQIANASVEIQTLGFGNSAPSAGSLLRIDGPELDALVECLKITTNAKTLASPRVLVLNGQHARIQVGEQLGFRVTTTTQTSSLQSVEFLDVGVVLEVMPRISRDGMVMMQVKPKVSTGRINPDTELPEEETSEVETNIMLRSGSGMVIGGLIQERDSDVQSKVPVLGDLWIIGKLFQRREALKTRSEIIVALVPHIVPYDPIQTARNQIDFTRAETPLVYGPLLRVPRPWEPRLPDSHDKPRRAFEPIVMEDCPPMEMRPADAIEPPALPPALQQSPSNVSGDAWVSPVDIDHSSRKPKAAPRLSRLPPLDRVTR
jgi:type IV pilus assembly protein PilQ